MFSSLANYEIIFIMAGMLIAGHFMGLLFKKIRMPQIIGTIFAGVLIKILIVTIFKQEILFEELMESLGIIISIALGIEAFLVGTFFAILNEKEEPLKVKKIYTLQLIFITTFTLLGLLFLHSVKYALLIGAIVGATVPIAVVQATNSVITKKRISSSLNKIVSFENFFGVLYFFIIYAIVRPVSSLEPDLITIKSGLEAFAGLSLAIIIGLAIGALIGLFNNKVLKDNDNKFIFNLGLIILTITGVLMLTNISFFDKFFISEYVVTFSAGIIFAKITGVENTVKQNHNVHGFIAPLSIIFFVLVGMDINLNMFTPKFILFISVYIVLMFGFKLLLSYHILRRNGIDEKIVNYLQFGAITKSSFEIYLAHLAMIATDSEAVFLVVIISILIFETIEPLLIKKSNIKYLENVSLHKFT